MKQHYINPAQQVRLWVLGALQLIQLIMLFVMIASLNAAAVPVGGVSGAPRQAALIAYIPKSFLES